MTGSSTQGIKTVLHPVPDLTTAKAVYAALLGVPPQADASYYVGFEAERRHIGLVRLPTGACRTSRRSWPRWPPSPTQTATSSGCGRTDECRLARGERGQRLDGPKPRRTQTQMETR